MLKFGDVAVVVSIILIVLIMIIPVPKGLLDILLSLNISFALLILLTSIYAKNVLSFSIFPSILLISTIFGLALNINTTRYILTEGDAGDVIQAFGSFVAQDNFVVGVIIFAIIVIVNFLVITKGSERVAEVAARFTLDAMPGKQMSIDADLNAGLISDEDAKARRLNIQREADFYGSMDGASKFVKGNAIAGILITVINIVAGLIIGAMSGMPIFAALSKYALLTIGDGLVSQISALMISTAQGIIVTKTESEKNLGSDIIEQLFRGSSRPLFILSAALIFMSLTPLPTFPFLLLGLTLLFIAFNGRTMAQKQEQEIEEQELMETAADDEEMRKPENVMNLLKIEDIELEFGYGLIPLADSNQGGDLLDRIIMIRRQIALELGVVVPIVRLRDNIQLNPNEYLIKIKGVEIARGELLFDHYLAMDPGTAQGDVEGIDTIEPAFGLPAKWVTDKEREKAEILGYTVVDPPSVISTHLTELIKQNAHELLGRQDVKVLIDNVKEDHPALVDEIVPGAMNLGDVQKVLANLLKEQISIRNMVIILETLADYISVTRDPDMLTEYVRQKQSRYITQKYVIDNKLNVITLDGQLEQLIMNSINQTEAGSYLGLDPNTVQRILQSLAQNVDRLTSIGEQPIVLTAPIVRIYFKKLTEQYSNEIIVLSYNEIDPNVEIQALGMVTLDEN
ncbi:MAG: flagellar biosynthesis protein FlhA [Tissierellales bacterium]|jgi:flagellar biosynthesis protein FlhA|nr:flagellar biosynthesis protein FlhA [Tissierellales bacterium]